MTEPATRGPGRNGSRLLREQFAVDAWVRSTELRKLTDVAEADPSYSDDPRREKVICAIREFLDTADDAVRRGDRLFGIRGPLDRWRGTSVAKAYQSLHAAEAFLLELLSEEQIRVLVPAVVARAQAAIDASDPRRAAIDQLPNQVSQGKRVGAALQQAMRIGYAASDEMHVRVRNFRNLLLSGSAVIVVLMAGLVWLAAKRPDYMPMCFAPGSTATAALQKLNVCPSGADHPTSGDVLIVAGLGLVGGALAAAFSIRTVRGTSTPYDVPIALALLKPPLGALTAVTSILLLGGDFVPGLSQLDSQRQILAYALVFGYAQQLVSRLIDNQAHTLLNGLPSKDSESRKPTGSVAAALPAPEPPEQEEPPPVARRRGVAARLGARRVAKRTTRT